jgi:rapamycin-insensitive companion of mTOR
LIEPVVYWISSDGHPRIVLSKALTSSDVVSSATSNAPFIRFIHFPQRTRLYATNHLGDLIRDSITPVAWTLRLLLTQIYDQAPEVCELAIQFLEEACDAMEVLQLVVEMQPTMDHLGEFGHPLLLKSVRSSAFSSGAELT